MRKGSDSYSFVVFSGSTASEPYRFSLKKRVCNFFLSFLFLSIVFLVGFSIQHYAMWNQLDDLKQLRDENKTQKIQIKAFSGSIEDLKEQMVRLVEFDRKLRVMTDIGPPQGSSESFGVGGTEEQGAAYSTSNVSVSSLSTSISQDLDLLHATVLKQKKSFQELEEVVQSRESLWASTPSIWPTSGWLSSSFGKRISPFTGHLAMHKGIDIAARPGTPVIAPAGGVVSYSRFNGGYGRYLKLSHGYGIESHYGHLSKTAVKVGQKVKRGDVIAYVGNTGLSTGPHLHYEILVNNAAVNPMKYILN